METELEETHPRGPVRQGPATCVSAVWHEFQAHQSSEQTCHTVPAHSVRRQSAHFLGVRVRVVLVLVHSAAHPQAAAPVPGRVAHHRRVHRDHHDVVAVTDYTGVAFEKSKSGPKLDFQYPKIGQLNE